MTLEELRDRIKNEVVLYEGELADWQWRQKGLVADASELGITDFTRLVNDISRQVNRDFGKILDLKKKIVTVALQRQNKLTEADVNQFVIEAERVQLSRTFVTEQWIPAILEALPVSSTNRFEPPSVTAGASAVSAETKPPTPVIPDPLLAVDKVESVRKKIKSILDDYDKHIQAQSLKFLFKAVDYDETALAEEIRLYLSENFYASVNPPRGATLKEKLISTDWRHLSWWEKEQPKPNPEPAGYVKTPTGYASPAAAANNGNGQTSRMAESAWTPPDRPQPVPPQPVNLPESSKKSSFSDAALIGLAILSALVLIWVVLRMTRGGDAEPEPERKRPKTHTSIEQKKGKSVESQNRTKKKKSARESYAPSDVGEDTEFRPAGEKKQSGNTEKTGSKKTQPYDQVDDAVGEFGLRAARKGRFWGYIDDRNKWIIEPQYDLVTSFNNGKASVELDGIQFFIDRSGNRIREDN
ncbi:WG repeat-containing protein [Larkinella rosea]|uniref:WG repeat-containing protein n=1 Tax=Larkinella rosea TaxID=2025312 RepID=A0A3P1B984_9BACT|nr:WG repeat-containing protein [Larkinella rosea]RRA97667.1 WG repeat-containing protein [Larkinella rosea]